MILPPTKDVCPVHQGRLAGRKGIGPTGRKTFMILVNYCYSPGCMYEKPAFPERMNFVEKQWWERFERRWILAIEQQREDS